jgi:hypothetical protein
MPNDIRQIVNDPEWQILRQSFVGTWMLTPSQNVRKLRNYLGDFSDSLKLRRVHNYLTGSGFRSGKIRSEEINKLLKEVKIKYGGR